jgi:hypothetical protein
VIADALPVCTGTAGHLCEHALGRAGRPSQGEHRPGRVRDPHCRDDGRAKSGRSAAGDSQVQGRSADRVIPR